MSFAVRVTFRLDSKGALLGDSRRFDVHPTNSKSILRIVSARTDGPIVENDVYALVSPGHNSEAEARQAGEAMIDSLLLFAVGRSRALDLGQVSSAYLNISNNGEEYFKRHFGAGMVFPSNLGMLVYPENPDPKFVSVAIEGIVQTPVETLVGFLEASLYAQSFESHNARNAAYLYTTVHFQVSPVSRFLLLFICLEAMIAPKAETDEVVKHVNFLVKATEESCLPDDKKASIVSTLKFSKQESIARAAKSLLTERLVGNQYLGVAPDRFFRKVYELRNRIVHKGHVENGEIQAIEGELNKCVIDLIKSHVVPCVET